MSIVTDKFEHVPSGWIRGEGLTVERFTRGLVEVRTNVCDADENHCTHITFSDHESLFAWLKFWFDF